MQQRLLLLAAIGLFLIGTVSGEDNTTAPAPTTTVKPKVTTEDSALCKRCSCDIKIQELDCRNRSMKEWFSDDEWNVLSNGDVSFVTIRLEYNNLTKVPVLRTMTVENLYLGHNLIENIENGAFRNLTNLTRLDLSYNKLTTKTLKPEAFEGLYDTKNYEPMKKLIELDLGHNELHSLDSSLFMHLPKLEVLILSANAFQRIDHSSEIAIAELYYLKTLDLSYMELDDLPDNLLHAPQDLETLILSGNLMDELPDGLGYASNLKRLTFDENPMKNMEEDNVFPNMSKLEYVSISYSNDLVRIGEGAFSKLSNLKTLVLQGNPHLEYIHPKAFATPTVNPIIFDYPPIQELFLHNNNLTTLDHDLLERWDKVKTIDLRENPWACNCDNSWLIKVLVKQINDTTPKLTEDLLCATPIAWKSKPLTDITMETTLRCVDNNHPENDGRLLIGMLIGILVGIPIAFGALIAYRRGCFGLMNRGNVGSQYNRASFNEDFHIKESQLRAYL